MAYLIIATVAVLLYIYMDRAGKDFEEIIPAIDGNEYPLKDFYTVGYGWQNKVKALGYHGNLAMNIRSDVSRYYGEKYCEFYSRTVLAQVYTIVHLGIAFSSVLATIVEDNGYMILGIGTAFSIALGWNYYRGPREKMENRAKECIEGFPDMVMELTLMINAGMILRDAWIGVAKNTKGQLKTIMHSSIDRMNNGASDVEAIYTFGVESGEQDIKKFANLLIQGIDKGNSELVSTLLQQSQELMYIKRQQALQKGEQAATKLVLPTSLMFVGLIIVIIVAATNTMGGI